MDRILAINGKEVSKLVPDYLVKRRSEVSLLPIGHAD